MLSFLRMLPGVAAPLVVLAITTTASHASAQARDSRAVDRGVDIIPAPFGAEGAMTTIRVDSQPRGALLEVQFAPRNALLDEDRWYPVCTTPCVVRVPIFAHYRLGEEDDIEDAEPFRLHPHASRQRVMADTWMSNSRAAGIVLTPIAGAALTLTGTLALMSGIMGDPDHDYTGIKIAAGVSFGALVSGIVLIVASPSSGGTTVTPVRPQWGLLEGADLALTPQGLVF